MHRHPHPCPHTHTFCTHVYHGFIQTRTQEHCHLLHPHYSPHSRLPRHILANTHTHPHVTKHTSSVRLQTTLHVTESQLHSHPTLLWGPHTHPPSPLLLTHSADQDHNAEAEEGQGPGPVSRAQHFWGLCPSVLSTPGWGRGRGRLHRAEPSPGRLPTPLGRDFRERGPGDRNNQRLCPPLLASLLPTLPAPWPDR